MMTLQPLPTSARRPAASASLSLWCSLAALILTLLPCPARALDRTIILAADEWPPYNTTPEERRQGFMVDIAREIFEPLGYTVVYRLMPWPRAVKDARNGLQDGIIGASVNDAPDFVFPEEECARSRLTFFVRENSTWFFTGPDSLPEVLLGCVQGYMYRPWLLEYVEKNADRADRVFAIAGGVPLERLLRMLVAGRLGAVVDTEEAVRYVARQSGMSSKIKPAGYDSEATPFYIAFSPGLPRSQELAQAFSKGVRRLRTSGRLAEILAEYGLADWK